MLAILFGLCSSVILIIGSLSISRPRILFCSLGINIFTGLQYWVMGHTSTLALVGLSILLVLTALSSLKWPALGSPTVMIAFLIAYPVLFFTVSGGHVETPTDIFPLFGVACATVGNFLKNSLNIKIAFMSAGLLWLVYESSVGAYGQMVGEILTLAGNTMSITLIILAARRGIASSEVPELNERISSWIRSHKRPTQVEAS